MLGLLSSHRLTFVDRQDVGGGVTSFAFRASEGLAYRPGQHCMLAVSAIGRRPFSLASAPGEEHVLFGTSLTPRTGFKKRLDALTAGDELGMRGPIYSFGPEFAIDEAAPRLVMLAQGVGITPFRSMLSHLDATSAETTTSLIHVAADGHAYRQDTERWATDSAYLDGSEAFRSAVTAAAGQEHDATFYVAGAPGFVSATTRLLGECDVDPGRVRADKYWLFKGGRNLAASARGR